MANWITANYVFVGDKDDVDALYDKLKEIEKTADPNKGGDFETHWLGLVVETLGGNVKKIPCHGEWYDLRKHNGRVYFNTDTANGTSNGVMDLICEYFESLKYFYRHDGDYPSTNDKNGKYLDRFKIELSTPNDENYKGKQFEGEKYFKTKEEAFKWVSETIGRPVTSKEDIEDISDKWEYSDEGLEMGHVYFTEFEYCSREDELGSRFFQDMFWQSQFSEEVVEEEKDDSEEESD